eukprot:351317-Chlamydomonas_euryale.AAC.9
MGQPGWGQGVEGNREDRFGGQGARLATICGCRPSCACRVAGGAVWMRKKCGLKGEGGGGAEGQGAERRGRGGHAHLPDRVGCGKQGECGTGQGAGGEVVRWRASHNTVQLLSKEGSDGLRGGKAGEMEERARSRGVKCCSMACFT